MFTKNPYLIHCHLYNNLFLVLYIDVTINNHYRTLYIHIITSLMIFTVVSVVLEELSQYNSVLIIVDRKIFLFCGSFLLASKVI
jgi:hypothetical protein